MAGHTSPLRSVERLLLAAAEKGDKKLLVDTLHRGGDLDINCVDAKGHSALIIAIQFGNTDVMKILLEWKIDLGDALLKAVDVQILAAVTILLEYIQENSLMEALNCHSLNGDLHPDITPVILAAHHNNYEIIKLLLDHGARVVDPEFHVFQTEKFSLQHSLGLINVYRALASQAYIALTSKDPLTSAFELSVKLRQLSERDYEFRYQYEELAEQCEQFAADLLGKVRDSEELAIVLNHDLEELERNGYSDGDEPYKVKRAIKCHQKRFVAHPHCQQRLIQGWYRGLPEWREQTRVKSVLYMLLTGLFYPLLCVIYIVAPFEGIARFLKIPFIRFICDTASSIWFLVLLGLQAVDWGSYDNQTGAEAKWTYLLEQQRRVQKPSFTEVLIATWTIALTWQECQAIWKRGYKTFLDNFQWKMYDFFTLTLYWAWMAVRVAVALKAMGRDSDGQVNTANTFLTDFYANNWNFSFFGDYSTGYFDVPSDYDMPDDSGHREEESFPLSFNETFEDMEDLYEGSALSDMEDVRHDVDMVSRKIDSLIQSQKKLEKNLTDVLSHVMGRLENAHALLERMNNKAGNSPYSQATSRSRGNSGAAGDNHQLDEHLTKSARKQWNAFDPVLISEGLFALAKVLSFLRVIRITVVSMHVGPMQISLGRMSKDIVKFLMIFSLVWFAFSVGLNQLYWYYSFESKLDCRIHNQTICHQPFGTIPEALLTLFWALFGVTELVSLDIVGADHWFTENVGKTLYGAYHVIAIVVLLNVLIAMMSNTYTRVEEDADMQWKYSRSSLWMSFFGDGQTLPPPFNVVPSVNCIMNSIKKFQKQRLRRKHILDGKVRKQSFIERKNGEYEQVVQRLVRRYIFDKRRVGDEEEGFDPFLMQIKQDITGFKYDMFETLSNMDVKMQQMQERMEEIEAKALLPAPRLPSPPPPPPPSPPPPREETPPPPPSPIPSSASPQSEPFLSSGQETGSTQELSQDPLFPLQGWGHMRYIDEGSVHSSNTSLSPEYV